ncbi:heavy-metal-associated domain-containing protein [Nocardioides rotundus]|uniref:heavy-metal-associated domain-containing protein n=1 Tax=Nocardioides rotundus TaxID=1774216 RepID=UPI001CC09E9E|nr:heavy-metal-associated domain-containing protein [Nocardioides rotundus]UAL29779.1 heavy-metal-associated domain-containing protein [Nocardioides rotundus]
MRAPARLGLYGAGLVAVFAVAFATAGAVVPEATVQAWAEEGDQHSMTGEDTDDMDTTSGHEGHDAGAGTASDDAAAGLGLAQDGYRLTAVSAPAETGTGGELSLTVTGPDGNAVTGFEVEHDKQLHLIVVRADGQHFAHVHPQMDAEGTWSIPWQWEAAGSYRVFADFIPADAADGVEGVTLSTSVQVAGDYAPVPVEPAAATTVDGFEVSVEGDLIAGSASTLTLTVSRDGEPVTILEPYLGAFGHLVALRDGDLAYLHVHPHGDAPAAGETSGPEIVFEATAPTPGRYLLYLDFQVDGQVHTAPLVIDTTATSGESGATDQGSDSGSGSDSDSGSGAAGESEEGADHDH